MLQTIPSSIFLQFGSFDLVEIYFPRKTLKGSLGTDNKAKGNDDDGWTLVSRKKKRHQAVLRIRLPKPRVIKNNAEHIRPPKSVKFDTSKKIDGALSRKDQRPITLYEFFPKKFLEDSIIGATHVISSTEEVIESKKGHSPMIAQELHANREVASCCAVPTPGRSLILYIASQERSLEALLAQKHEDKKEQALYYLSRTLIGAKINYTPIEKMCLALLYAIKKLRHYFKAYTIKLISRADPMKFAMKGETLVNFLDDHPLPAEWEVSDEFPNEDVLFIEELLPWTMLFDGSAQYQALIVGLEMELDIKIAIGYQWFDQVFLNHVLREENCMADALDNLATTLHSERKSQQRCKYVIDGLFLLLEDPRKRAGIKRRAPRFIFHEEISFHRSDEGLFLRSLDKEESQQTMEEAHSGMCGAHQSGPKLHFCIKNMGFYWPTMVLDVVGPLLKSSKGKMYILVATDYFSKWVEVMPLKEVKKENIVDFIKSNIIFRYGIPRCIVTDNGTPFNNKLMKTLCEKFNFKQHKSSIYNAPANGLAEAFNKTLGNLLTKVVTKNKRDLHEKIGEALWAYRTNFRTATQATPYSLVYGVEAVLPLEQQILSL
ncbi:uncharacterized protein LOC124899606 [Capsicum annuum]|uniref:uncharacterized protein LOC124899606 n=1 Tax=Capsicum annuum TaxID=4072 RepID=UPI001FB08BB3|nr:uncharacterized protein LOC124899606 [Capsicum annuum]